LAHWILLKFRRDFTRGAFCEENEVVNPDKNCNWIVTVKSGKGRPER
jgi:hypothetical protein